MLSRIGQFHENSTIIAGWITFNRRALDWATPIRRRTLLAVLAILTGLWQPWYLTMRPNDTLQLPSSIIGFIMVAAGVFFLLWLCFLAARDYENLPGIVRRHPLVSLHLVYWGVIVLLLNTTPAVGEWRAIVVGIAVVIPLIIWRCSYLLLSGQNGRMTGTSFFRDHLFYLWSAWSASNVPLGKGLEYLSSKEARTTEELARSQLAGIKLIGLGISWYVFMGIMDAGVYGRNNSMTAYLGGYTLAMPDVNDLAGGKAAGVSLWVSWVSIYIELIREVLRHAINGHIAIGILRLFGFNVFRNTYKPLLAESVMAFWGRYYYYFKEMLVHFFFMPTFAQLGTTLRNWPNLRLFAAVFAAAFIGNTYYHMLRTEFLLGDFYPHTSRMFYCLLLSIGIFVSMWRQQRGAGRGPGLQRRTLRIAGVWTFFALINIWNTTSQDKFLPRTEFFLSLFGLA